MKKVKYILVLVVLAGLFSPIVEVGAQNKKGVWVSVCNVATPGEPARLEVMSQAACGTTTRTGAWVSVCNVATPGEPAKLEVMSQAECVGQGSTTKKGVWVSVCNVAKPGEAANLQVMSQAECATTTRRGAWVSVCNVATPGQPAKLEVMSQAECVGGGNNVSNTTTTDSTAPTSVYTLLAPLPCESSTPGCVDGKLTTFDPTQPNNLSTYLNIAIKIIIGLAAVLSVVMIVVGGIQYMTSELAHTKEAGKERILHAILGLIIALGAYALLFTINPDLLKIDDDIIPEDSPATNNPPAIRPGGQ